MSCQCENEMIAEAIAPEIVGTTYKLLARGLAESSGMLQKELAGKMKKLFHDANIVRLLRMGIEPHWLVVDEKLRELAKRGEQMTLMREPGED